MKIISWNIAGLRSKLKKKYIDNIIVLDYDIICFQESKGSKDEIELLIPDQIKEIYKFRYYNSCLGEGNQRKGFNGVCIWSKFKAKKIIPNMVLGNDEGRIIAIDMGNFQLVNVYTPNGQYYDSIRYNFRINKWDINFKNWINSLKNDKKTIVCGDFNVAHKNIDLHYKWGNILNKEIVVGASPKERENFNNLINDDWIDIYRKNNEDKQIYTYWDQRIPIFRTKNIGWRIDYFMISKGIEKFVKNVDILNHIYGSDHCPITIEINLNYPKKYLKIKS